MAKKKSKKKKKKKKSGTKKQSSKKTAIKKVSTDNVKSFMKMNKDMNTAVFGFAQELKLRGTEISPTQMLTQSLKYLKTYAHSHGVGLDALSVKVSPVPDKDYSVTSVETLARLRKQMASERKLNLECNSEMRKHKMIRTAVRKKAAGKKK